MNLPDNLPPLPPVPEGFDRWEYRGMLWDSPDHCVHAVYYCDNEPWEVFRRCPHSGIMGESHYLEAVREPAEPSAQLFATLAEQITYALLPDASGDTVAKAARIIADYSEPAKDQPASDPNNLEGNGRTIEEMAAAARELNRTAPTPADKFALMFGKSERPTPLTDAAAFDVPYYGDNGTGTRIAVVHHQFARDLERQLAEAREALEDLVAREDQQEPFNGLDMGRAHQALALIKKTETP